METLRLFKRSAAVIGTCMGLVGLASAQTDAGFPAPTQSRPLPSTASAQM